ncbi:hypothetical protein NPIL_487631 [Nephila pilipes]|uniref:Uncharacterized protein n=1 Tax=Nephila pilipes TaxID=299642 RepID=A0A8X6U9A8_NEPPI|nr:hypothetical protein NPIL_487631 [Nephila pilipes]
MNCRPGGREGLSSQESEGSKMTEAPSVSREVFFVVTALMHPIEHWVLAGLCDVMERTAFVHPNESVARWSRGVAAFLSGFECSE